MSSEQSFLTKVNEESILFLDTFTQLVPGMSQFFSSSQLTYASLLWACIIAFSGYQARNNTLWLWLVVVGVCLHMTTDLIDGTLSKYMKDGMDKWNFFMDHLFDYIMALALLACFSSLTYGRNTSLFIIFVLAFALVSINMVASFILVFENGLDLGINIGQIKFNIFHMHFIVVAYLLFVIFTNGNVLYRTTHIINLLVMLLVMMLFVLTFLNIYQKQKKLLPDHK